MSRCDKCGFSSVAFVALCMFRITLAGSTPNIIIVLSETFVFPPPRLLLDVICTYWPLFVCSSVFQLNSRAGSFKAFVCQVTPQRWSGGNGWTHRTHSSSLLSYLAGERWWYPFPPSNVFALHPMPSVNTQLLESHFSFGASSRVE